MFEFQNPSSSKVNLLLQLGEALCDSEFQCHKKGVSRFAAVVNQSLDAKSRNSKETNKHHAIYVRKFSGLHFHLHAFGKSNFILLAC